MKATKAEVWQRVNEVLAIRLDGAEFHDILQYAAEKGWGVGERQLWNYVRAADKLLVERLERDRDKLFARHVGQRRALLGRCVTAGDYSTASRILRDEAELLGLYPPKRTELTGQGGGVVQLRIIEEVVGRGPPAQLGNVVEEVVTSDHNGSGDGTRPAPPDDPLASRTAGLPPL